MLSLGRQGAEGDVNGNKPAIVFRYRRRVYEEWEKLKGMDINEAQI